MRALSNIPLFAWTLKSQDELEATRAAGFDAFIIGSFEAQL